MKDLWKSLRDIDNLEPGIGWWLDWVKYLVRHLNLLIKSIIMNKNIERGINIMSKCYDTDFKTKLKWYSW